MSYNPEIHHRKSIRLKGYDYSQAGLYFTTICTQNRACLFGDIIVSDIDDTTNCINGLSGNMILNDAGKMVEYWYNQLNNKFNDKNVIRWFKTMTTNQYIRGVKQNDWVPFASKLWQRNYWEHIIRNDIEYDRITQYIIKNPQQWTNDHLK